MLSPLGSETEATCEVADEWTDREMKSEAGEDSVPEPGWPRDKVSAILPGVAPWRSRGEGGEWDDIVDGAVGWVEFLSGAPPPLSGGAVGCSGTREVE
jgi:hypothetical protein